MKYRAQMQKFANWIASSPTPLQPIRIKELIDDFSFRLYDGKANPISIRDLQKVRKTLELTLIARDRTKTLEGVR